MHGPINISLFWCLAINILHFWTVVWICFLKNSVGSLSEVYYPNFLYERVDFLFQCVFAYCNNGSTFTCFSYRGLFCSSILFICFKLYCCLLYNVLCVCVCVYVCVLCVCVCVVCVCVFSIISLIFLFVRYLYVFCIFALRYLIVLSVSLINSLI